MYWKKEKPEPLYIDKIATETGKEAHILQIITEQNDFSCAVSYLVKLADISEYGSRGKIPTTLEAIDRYATAEAVKVYRRLVGKDKIIFSDVPDDKVIIDEFSPSLKALMLDKAESRAVKPNRTAGQARVNSFIADLYKITPGSKIVLSSKDSLVPLSLDAVIDSRLHPLELSLYPQDAKVLFGWEKIPREFREGKYRGRYSIERVIQPEALNFIEKSFQTRLEESLNEAYEQINQTAQKPKSKPRKAKNK
jgi:hypothetical protein